MILFPLCYILQGDVEKYEKESASQKHDLPLPYWLCQPYVRPKYVYFFTLLLEVGWYTIYEYLLLYNHYTGQNWFHCLTATVYSITLFMLALAV